jgi:hypothetical protein
VAVAQNTISERTSHDFEARLANARARADRLQQSAIAAADPGSRGAASVPGLSSAAGGPSQAAEDRLSLDEALAATEQAIQLDELIKWVERQHAIDPSAY